MTEQVEEQRCDVVEHSVEAYTAEIIRLTLDGWAVSPTCPGDAVGFGSNTYTCSMFRNVKTVDDFKSKVVNVGDKPKMSRAEVLQVARQAKAAKATLDVSTVQ